MAAAVAKSHPERALEIYRRHLDATLPRADVSAYESAVRYLKMLQLVTKSPGKRLDWAALQAEIRETYRNRPRFMEILDRLEGRTPKPKDSQPTTMMVVAGVAMTPVVGPRN